MPARRPKRKITIGARVLVEQPGDLGSRLLVVFAALGVRNKQAWLVRELERIVAREERALGRRLTG